MNTLIIKKKQYKPAPDGIWDATCVDVLDLGEVQTQFGLKEQVRVTWELDVLTDEDRRHLLSKTYSKSLADKSTLLKDLLSWTGGLTDKELDSLDLESFIGRPCRLLVVHKPGKEGKIFANVDRVLKPGDEKIEASGSYTRIKDRTIEKCIDAALLK